MTCAVSSHGSKLLPVRTRRPFSSAMLKVSTMSPCTTDDYRTLENVLVFKILATFSVSSLGSSRLAACFRSFAALLARLNRQATQ